MAPRKKRKSIRNRNISPDKLVSSGIQKQTRRKLANNNKRETRESSQEIIVNETSTSLIEDVRNKSSQEIIVNEASTLIESVKNSIRNKTVEPCPVHDVEIVSDEKILSADFIPLTIHHAHPLTERIGETLVSSSTSNQISGPMTITVDDDNSSDCDSICIAEKDTSSDSESDSVNESIQILEVPKYSSNARKLIGRSARKPDSSERNMSLSVGKKRKFDDSIEIIETVNAVIHCPAKKVRKTFDLEMPSLISSTVASSSGDEKRNCQEQDDDIVIVDTIDNSRNSVKVVNDYIPFNIPSTLIKEKNRRKMMFTKRKCPATRETNIDVSQSCVFQDTVGNTVEHSAKYKSPISSFANQDSDTNVSYHNVYGNNMYNPNSVQKTGLRPVVIDGSNVAFGHGGKSFSTRGIEICVDYFVKRGHWVVAFVPLFRRNEVSEADRKILDDLKKENQLAFTPSRYLHGRRVASYDDRFIVQCAAELGGIVVSTDNYRDLVGENEAWRETIEKRLLMFTWVGDLLMFPDDPNGRGGPRLAEFLRFPQ